MTRSDDGGRGRDAPAGSWTVLVVLAGSLLALAARSSFAQTVSPPVEVRIERQVVTVTYDLLWDDLGAAFDVSLVVTDAAGRVVEVRAASLSGDVGRVETPGRKKTVTWDAGADAGAPRLDQYTYKITAVRVVLTGDLLVQTDPAGATVAIVDEVRGSGETPVVMTGLKAGPLKIIVSKAGYQDARVDVQIEAGKVARVSQRLVPVAPRVPAGTRPTGPAVKLPGLPKRGTFLGGAFTESRGFGYGCYEEWGYNVNFAQDIATSKWVSMAIVGDYGQGLQYTAWSLTGGVRVAGNIGRLRPFVQLHTGRSLGVSGDVACDLPNCYSWFYEGNAPTNALGAGAEILLGRWINLRLAVDILHFRVSINESSYDPTSFISIQLPGSSRVVETTRLALGLTVALKRPR